MQVLSHQCFSVVGRSKTVLLLWRHLFHVVVLFGPNACVVIHPVVFGYLKCHLVGRAALSTCLALFFALLCLLVTFVVSRVDFRDGPF